jgi:hypothetical protein
MKEVMKEVYEKGFNIYRCLNKMKKVLKLTEDFPPQAVIWTCESFLRKKTPTLDHWAWFVRVFRANSERFFSERHVKMSENSDKRGGFAKSIKNILKGIDL